MQFIGGALGAAINQRNTLMPTQEITMNVITATMDDAAAFQLAQFCKRSTFNTFYEMTEAHLDHDERKTRAYQMIAGIEAVQRALSEAGFTPR